MGSTLSVIKTLIVPAIIALLGYLVLTYAVIPLWQRYRSRYSQYLPLNTISNQTSSLRHRIQSGIGRLVVPSSWRQRLQEHRLVVEADGDSDVDYNSDEGEELGDINEDRRRELSQGELPDMTRRLSRDLEQGFMDDSDEETPTAR